MLSVTSDHLLAATAETRREATARLLAEARATDGPARARLEDELVRLNLSVATDLAGRYRGRSIDLADLEQVACLALVKAIRAFDPGRSSSFLGFAVPTIRGELRRHFRDQGWSVRPPRGIQELQYRISDAEGALTQRLGRSPRPSELARHLAVEEVAVVEALAARGCFAPSSLDDPVVDGEGALIDRLGGVDATFETAELRLMLGPMLDALTERERLILELRFFRGWTQSEIGGRLGITQAQVSRLLATTLVRLRERWVRPTAA